MSRKTATARPLTQASGDRLDDGPDDQAVSLSGCQLCGTVADTAGRLRRQPLEQVAQVCIGIVPVETR